MELCPHESIEKKGKGPSNTVVEKVQKSFFTLTGFIISGTKCTNISTNHILTDKSRLLFYFWNDSQIKGLISSRSYSLLSNCTLIGFGNHGFRLILSRFSYVSLSPFLTMLSKSWSIKERAYFFFVFPSLKEVISAKNCITIFFWAYFVIRENEIQNLTKSFFSSFWSCRLSAVSSRSITQPSKLDGYFFVRILFSIWVCNSCSFRPARQPVAFAETSLD